MNEKDRVQIDAVQIDSSLKSKSNTLPVCLFQERGQASVK